MQITKDEIREILVQMPLFAHLTVQAIDQLAGVMRVASFQKGVLIFDMGHPANAMFVVVEGQVERESQSGEGGAVSKLLRRGDFFGEEALLFDDPREYRVTAVADCLLLRFDVEDYLALWDDLPGIESRLEILIQSQHLSKTKSLSWLQADEHLQVMARRHTAVLWGKLVLPVLTFLGVILLFGLMQFSWLPDRIYGWIILAVGLPLNIFWFVWRVIDWKNDYFIVTNKRVVWIEKVALIYESRQEAPLRTIMSVGIQRSRIGTLIGFADVVVTTYVGTIRLRDLAQAETIASLIESYWHRAKSVNRREEAKIMTEILAGKLGFTEETREGTAEALNEPSPAARISQTLQGTTGSKEPGFFAWLLDDFIRLRYEMDGAVVYRKHWFKLVESTWLPVVLMISGVVSLAARLAGRLAFLPMMPALIVILVFMFFMFLWVIYQYADWRNDIFKVTLEQIIDIDRKPLGKVRQRSAPLENVLSIEYQRKGFWGFLFNFGTVSIAVGNMQLTFDHVYNPSEVQQDIFYRMGERLEHIRQFEIDSERERVSEWIASYHRKVADFNSDDRQS